MACMYINVSVDSQNSRCMMQCNNYVEDKYFSEVSVNHPIKEHER